MKIQQVTDKDLKLLISHCLDHTEIQKWPIEKLAACFKLLVLKFEKTNAVKIDDKVDKYKKDDIQ